MSEIVVHDEQRPGIEVLELAGTDGYDDERMRISNGLSNGLRIEVWDLENDETGTFHVASREIALLMARRLSEWAARIGDPVDVTRTRRRES